MAEALVRRSLLAGGLLLAWLLLFHLLLNIWLLCVLASLLVALGGWLTSHAILESNNLVHLERFIRLEQVRLPPPASPRLGAAPWFSPLSSQIPSTADDRRRLDQEIRSTVRKIIRDFVTSWFATVSSEGAFEGEVQAAMIAMAAEMKTRAAQVDRKVRGSTSGVLEQPEQKSWPHLDTLYLKHTHSTSDTHSLPQTHTPVPLWLGVLMVVLLSPWGARI